MYIFLDAINFVSENMKKIAAVKIKKAKRQKKLNVLFIISDDGEYYDSNMNRISLPYDKQHSFIEYEHEKPEYNDTQDSTQEGGSMPTSDTMQLVPQTEKLKIEDTIKMAGYAYDFIQNIFYSRLDAWQRKYGYCQLYDEACAPMSMIIDCEPIYFDYDNKHWLIEFWKGQYGLTAGCEVGVYASKWPDLNIPGVFNGTFYKCADDNNLLDISYTLYRNGKALFERRDKHWWLTGFILGDFAQPQELSMDIKILFKNSLMQNAFIGGLKNAGYKSSEIRAISNVVYITFNTPRTKQPHTRTEEVEAVTQGKNKFICEQFQKITKGLDNIYDKIYAVKQHAPDIYDMIFDFGKAKDIYDKFNLIKNALELFTGGEYAEYAEDEETHAGDDQQTRPSEGNNEQSSWEMQTPLDENNQNQSEENDDEDTDENEQEMYEDNEQDYKEQEEYIPSEQNEGLSSSEEQIMTEEEKREIEDKINVAGFAYDVIQDIFYSKMNAWQRKFGYCRLYDEACAPLSIIIDCEPIYFDYDNKHWLIEFWKGQYGMTAGGEVGVYISSDEEINIPDIFKGLFYQAVNDDDMLEISYTLYKNNTPLFRRNERHWWLTGFILGGYAQPYELSMDIKIAFKNSLMQSAFVNSLKNAGYKSGEIRAINNIVYISFKTPHTAQPLTRNDEVDAIMQAKNKLICEQYQYLTDGIDNIYEKINVLKQQEPDIYDMIFNFGKTRQIFDEYEIIRKYL